MRQGRASGGNRWIRRLAPVVVALAALLACAAAVALIVTGGGGDAADDCTAQKFDRAAWRAPDAQARGGLASAPSVRQRLADDLVACHRLDGLRRSAVIRLLGPPSLPGGRGEDRRSLAYELGPGRSGGRLDNEFLYISLSRRLRVSGASLGSG